MNTTEVSQSRVIDTETLCQLIEQTQAKNVLMMDMLLAMSDSQKDQFLNKVYDSTNKTSDLFKTIQP